MNAYIQRLAARGAGLPATIAPQPMPMPVFLQPTTSAGADHEPFGETGGTPHTPGRVPASLPDPLNAANPAPPADRTYPSPGPPDLLRRLPLDLPDSHPGAAGAAQVVTSFLPPSENEAAVQPEPFNAPSSDSNTMPPAAPPPQQLAAEHHTGPTPPHPARTHPVADGIAESAAPDATTIIPKAFSDSADASPAPVHAKPPAPAAAMPAKDRPDLTDGAATPAPRSVSVHAPSARAPEKPSSMAGAIADGAVMDVSRVQEAQPKPAPRATPVEPQRTGKLPLPVTHLKPPPLSPSDIPPRPADMRRKTTKPTVRVRIGTIEVKADVPPPAPPAPKPAPGGFDDYVYLRNYIYP